MIQENVSDTIRKDIGEYPSIRRQKLNEHHRGYTGCLLPPEISEKLTPEVKETLSNMVRYGIIKDSAFVFDKLGEEKKRRKERGGRRKLMISLILLIRRRGMFNRFNSLTPMNF